MFIAPPITARRDPPRQRYFRPPSISGAGPGILRPSARLRRRPPWRRGVRQRQSAHQDVSASPCLSSRIISSRRWTAVRATPLGLAGDTAAGSPPVSATSGGAGSAAAASPSTRSDRRSTSAESRSTLSDSALSLSASPASAIGSQRQMPSAWRQWETAPVRVSRRTKLLPPAGDELVAPGRWRSVLRRGRHDDGRAGDRDQGQEGRIMDEPPLVVPLVFAKRSTAVRNSARALVGAVRHD